ncbi:unnamed protein product [Hermetia illucens]|uniref:C2H2-type domain-containing protein n=1 Tax=Hermetia illucens TaxID=343691 RepID=A0A7R8YN63_HERIL|nr:vicilin-like seed storage protein At2g18540 [Hermetia illucens]CAD7079233.1 unnamed protein product [Hermetia illucens]
MSMSFDLSSDIAVDSIEYSCLHCNLTFADMNALMQHELTSSHQNIVNRSLSQSRIGIQRGRSQTISQQATSGRNASQVAPQTAASSQTTSKENTRPVKCQPGSSAQNEPVSSGTRSRQKKDFESKVVPYTSLDKTKCGRPRKRIESKYPKKLSIPIPPEVQQGIRALELSDLPDPSSREKTLDVKRWMRQAFRAQIKNQLHEGREDAKKAGEEPDMFKIASEDLGATSMGELSRMLRDIKRKRKEVRKRGRERRRQREREEMENEEDEEEEEEPEEDNKEDEKEEEEKKDEQKEQKEDEKKKE